MINLVLLIALALAQCCSVPQQTGAVASSGGGSAITHIQTCTGSSASTVASVTVTCGGATTVGDTLMWQIKVNNTGTVFTVTGETLTACLLATCPANPYSTNEIYVFEDVSITTSRSSYTLNCGNVNCSFPNISVDEFAPHGHTMAVDQVATYISNGVGGTSATSNSVTPGQNNELLFCPVSVNNGPTVAFTAPYVLGAANTGGQNNGYLIQATAASTSCTATWTGTQGFGVGLLSFK